MREGEVMAVTRLRAAISSILDYRFHVTGCEITQTDFCSCGLREAVDELDAAWKADREATEALLLQRAQESQELLQAVLDAIKGTIDTSTNIADHPNVKFAQMERLKLESALTARAQEIEQVKALIRWLLGEEGDFPLPPERVPGKVFPLYWWRSELRERFNALQAADAALVSRAPQQEQEHGDR